jgi:hypothetical protein
MILLAVKILTVWTAVSLAAGFWLGAVIRTAERANKEQFLNALYATQADEQIGIER